MGRIWNVLTRKKAIDPVTVEETRLNRVLNVFDLTALGVGSTLGVGIYVLAGQVAKDITGPSVVLSFLIAAVASLFAALCYAEFGARAPRAGSAYIYSYVCVGELIAFIIGWNLIMEYAIGAASVARGLSLYLDVLLNNTLQDTFREIAPINIPFLAEYFDFFSFAVPIVLAIGLAFGLKASSWMNNIMTCLNMLVVLLIIVAGALNAHPANWNIIPTNATNTTITGSGGFFPWGVEGMIKGSATCFYGFIGFDCIATTGEEVKNPRKAIPIAIIVSLTIIFLSYFGVATVLTMMQPYYLLDHSAPIPRAFETVGWEWAKWTVSIGAVFGLCASLFGSMFPLPRIIYAMASDGLIFRFLAKVSPRFQSPVVGTLLAGFLSGLLAALFDLSQLIKMLSIGTLLAYTIVAACVLLLRYKDEVKKAYIPIKTSSDTESVSSEGSIDERYNDDRIRDNFDGPTTSDQQELINTSSNRFTQSLKYIINCSVKEPNRITENIVAVEVLIYCILCIGIGICVIHMKDNIADGEIWAIVLGSIILGLTIMVLVSLISQPKSRKELSFKVPFVPLIPAISIMINIGLMLMLDFMTWVRFGVWMAIGLPMYYTCACVRKPYISPTRAHNYSANIASEHANKNNGIPNPGFIITETNGTTEKRPVVNGTKKNPAPPPPVSLAPPPPSNIEPTIERIEMQQEAAIAQLDEILEKEVAIAQLDDVLENEDYLSRKLSLDEMSDLSNVASRSENVVADVHCANVVTPIVESESPAFPIVVPPVSSEKIFDDESCNSADTEVALDDVSHIENIVENPENDITLNDVSPNRIENNVIFDYKEDTPVFKDLTQKSDEIFDNKIPKPPEESITEFTIKIQAEDRPKLPSVPSYHDLKSITLRHVTKEIKEKEPIDSQTASDTNLKPGSKEYKTFITSLDTKLKRTPLRPNSFYVPSKKDVVINPQPIEPNENVIEDNINQTIAKNKLKEFYEARNAPALQSSISVVETVKLPKESLNEVENPYDGDQFGSLKQKKTEDDLKLKRRMSKSLSSSFTKDDAKDHKQKMADIFHDIKALRSHNKPSPSE